MRLVVAVAEERNFTRAARRCNVTQSALSRRVQEVEQTLGTKLFERRTRLVSVTPAGKLFVREAKRVLDQSRRAISLVQALARQHDRAVAIGVSALADLPNLQALIHKAQHSVSNVAVSVRIAHTPEILSGLLRGDVDLALVDLPSKEQGIRFAPIAAELLVAALPERLSSSRLRRMRLAQIATAPLVLLSQSVDPARSVINDVLSSVSARAFKVHDAASIPELLDEVALHGRLGLLRQSFTRFQRQGVAYKPLVEPIHAGCALAWRSDQRWSASVSFRDALLAFSQQLQNFSSTQLPCPHSKEHIPRKTRSITVVSGVSTPQPPMAVRSEIISELNTVQSAGLTRRKPRLFFPSIAGMPSSAPLHSTPETNTPAITLPEVRP